MPYGQFAAISDVVVQTVTLSADSSTSGTWTYNIAPYVFQQLPTSTVTAPDQSYTQYTGACFIYTAIPLYQFQAKQSCKEASRSIYTAQGTLMKSVSKRFDLLGETLQEATSIYDGPHPLQQLTQYTYDTYSNVIEKDESDFYTCASSPCSIPTQSASLSAPTGGWLRQTFTTYAYSQPYCPQAGTCPSGEAAALTTAHIVNKPSQVLVNDGNGHPYSLTQYGYDEPNTTGFKGDLTTESHCASLTNTTTVTSATAANACSGWLKTKHSYDSHGQVLSTTDPAGNTTGFDYTNNYVGFTPSSQTDGYIKTVTHPDGTTDSYSYYYYTGQVASHAD
jgi:hypothetical protein